MGVNHSEMLVTLTLPSRERELIKTSVEGER